MVRYCRSPFEGYRRNAPADRARTRGGWCWTGDRFFRDADGFFHFAGRSDDRLLEERDHAALLERYRAHRREDLLGR